ncbi:polysaccharide deacetylase family protein [Saccharothrix obliqua]|uniref:polysaccharide deacetylase family protein n=1 Tax=Saccharothrix obliqua TaxID=2861747 RepID=UPI001C5DEB47|nr:polysaccharide deacetylase family protein [Saccharothrix obliqua]MBW4720660.1 polysaccharide deacetylase family protein [Saccharothrix obliqua]
MLLRTLLVVALLALAPVVPANAAEPVDPANAARGCTGYVALTYDDGPRGADYTRPLLAALRAAGARATFFDVGARAWEEPELVRATARERHWIANHSWSHPYLTKLSASEVAKEIASTQDVLRRITGHVPTLFRPPYGDTNATVEAQARALGLEHVLWTVDTLDWSGKSTEEIVRSATGAEAGDVVLMHDGYPATVAAVPLIVRGLKDKGLCPGRILNGRAIAP